MKTHEVNRLMTLLADANPNSVFLEVAFLESWLAVRRKRGGRVPLAMLRRALPFFEREFRWIPRPDFGQLGRPAWNRLALRS